MSLHINAPAKYIQGPNELANLALYCKNYSKQAAYVLVDAFILEKYGPAITQSFKGEDYTALLEKFNGECSYNEINRIIELVKPTETGVIVGIGGGKTLDTAKAVAFKLNLPMIIVPTAASTDAPTSALSVIYTDEGEVTDYLFLKENPNLVLMDTEIIAKAPSRLLVAGIGDALATYFEARACAQSRAKTMAGGLTSLAAMALAELSYDVLLENGLKAKLSAEEGLPSQALMAVIEANTYLSGIGFESAGLAAAHAIHDGITCIPETHHMLHGEKVAFGTLAQLVLENAALDEIDLFIDFCREVGLPTTLKELGIIENVKDKVMIIAKAACAEGTTTHNMPFAISAESVANAILVADKLGR